MKRLFIVLSLLSMVFGITAFECASSEMNAAKMYMADNVKNYTKAREQLNLELAKNPKSDEAYFLLGKIDYIQSNVPSMIENFDKSLAISAKFKSDITYYIAKTWETDFNRGIAYYNRAQKFEGDSSKALYRKALDAFKSAMECLPDTAAAFENYVFTAINLNELDLIEAPLKKLVASGKKADHFTLLGKFYVDKGNKAKEAKKDAEATSAYDEAIKVLNQGRAKFPSNQGLLETLANAYVVSGKIDEAKASFSEGVKSQPNNKVFRYNYGTILLDAKDFEGAEEQLKKAVELDPNYLEAIYNLAACYVNWGVALNEKQDPNYKEKIKMALPLLNKYLEKKPDDSDVWEILAKAQTGLGNKAEAEEAYKKADQYRK